MVWLLTHPIQYFVNLIDELHRRGHVDVFVIYADSGEDFHDRAFGQKVDWNSRPGGGFPFLVLEDANARGFSNPLSTRSRFLADELERLKPDVLHLNSYNNALQWQGFLWARRKRIPYLFRGDGDLVAKRYNLFRPIRRAVFRPIVANAVRVFTQGRENSRFMLDAGACEAQLTWIPCVSDSRRFREKRFAQTGAREQFRKRHGAGPGDCVFVYCGKFITRKRAGDLVEAVAKAANPKLKVWFLGSGELEKELRARTASLGIDSQVVWHGFQSQDAIPEFLQAADVFVHPSQWDPWPYAVLDAATSGLPLILSDRTGCHADWMADPVSGATYECGNPAALAETMLRFAMDEQLRSKCGQNAAGQASRHTETVFCDIFEKEVLKVLKGKQA